jgi:hypothetical protein
VVEVHVGEEDLLDLLGLHPDLGQHRLRRLPVVEAEPVDPLLGVEAGVHQMVVHNAGLVLAAEQDVDHR